MNTSRSALSKRDFRFFWFGQGASLFGDRLASIALALYVTLELEDPVGFGLIMACQVAALALVLLFGGVVADRLDRRRLIITTDLICFALHGVTAVLVVTGTASIANLLIIETVFGICEAFYRPAFSGLLPQTVDEDQIQSAWSFAGASESAALALGPAAATLLFFSAGPAWAFAGDSVTFLASAVSLLFVSPRRRSSEQPRSESMLNSIRTGWGEVVRRRWVWVTISSWSLLLMLSLAPWFVLGPVVGEDLYGSGSVYGIHEACFGAGMVIGSLVGGRIRPLRPLRTGLLLMSVWPAQFIAFGLGAPLATVFASAVAAGIALGVWVVLWESSLARWIPPDRLSRVSSWDWMGSTVLMPIGFVLAGPLATVVDPANLIVAAGAIGGACIGIAAMPGETRRLSGDPSGVRR